MIPNVEEHEKAISSNRKSEKESRLSFICDLPAWWNIKKEDKEEMQEFGFPAVVSQCSVMCGDKRRAEPELNGEIWSSNTVVQVQISNSENMDQNKTK